MTTITTTITDDPTVEHFLTHTGLVKSKTENIKKEKNANLWNELADGSVVEIDGVARMPLAVSIVEFEFHKVAIDGGEEHAARDGAVGGGDGDGVVELEDLVAAGAAIPEVEAAVPGQDPDTDFATDCFSATLRKRQAGGRRRPWGLGFLPHSV